MPSLLRLRLMPRSDVLLRLESGPAHGWFHALIARCDPDWSAALHPPESAAPGAEPGRESQPPPYTLSPLYLPSDTVAQDDLDFGPRVLCAETGRRGRTAAVIRAGQPVALRLALADDDRARWLCRTLADHAELPPLGNSPCHLMRLPRLAADDPDARHASWATLAAAPPPARLHVSFVTPTAFSHRGESLLLPEPERLLESWRRGWGRAPAMPEGADDIPSDALRLTRYALRTEPLSLKGGLRIGFVGEIEMTWRKGTPERTRQAVTALAGLADFLGTGAKTALGMGQTRVRFAESSR